MIALAERAENHLEREKQKMSQRSGKTQTGLENRASKRNRINEAKQKYAGD